MNYLSTDLINTSFPYSFRAYSYLLPMSKTGFGNVRNETINNTPYFINRPSTYSSSSNILNVTISKVAADLTSVKFCIFGLKFII